jgi:hypothetical protein
MQKTRKMAAFFFILVLTAVILAKDVSIATAWYGDTDGDCPSWNSDDDPLWEGDGWYCQCHHRSPYYGDEDDCWTATGVMTNYDIVQTQYPPYCGYDYVYWSWCSSTGDPAYHWDHWDAMPCTASVNLTVVNTYYDDSEPQWQWIFDIYGYTRFFYYYSTCFDPPVSHASGSTGGLFYNVVTWEFYWVTSESEPWGFLHAHL